MQTRKSRRKLKMIINNIKDSIRKSLNKMDENLIFHFDKILHTGFPYAYLKLNDLKIHPTANSYKNEYIFYFQLIFQKSEENKISELLEYQNLVSKAVLPVLSVNNKKITLDDVNFSISEKKLLMEFKMNFYVEETQDFETMQTLDITIKGGENAR